MLGNSKFKNLEKIRECLRLKGIELDIAIPMSGDNSLDMFTAHENGKRTEFRWEDFLRYAKAKGCYCETLEWTSLTLTKNISAQEEILCKGLGWDKKHLNRVLERLAGEDAVCLTISNGERQISLGILPLGRFEAMEITLYNQLEEYVPHT